MTATRAAAPGPVDAVAILTAGHDSLKKQFSEFRLFYLRGERAEAEAVARRICREWTIHSTIEEEIFYPEARAAIGDAKLVDDANADRAAAKELVMQILDSAIEDEKFAARVSMLAEYINHHIREEQEEVFPQARSAGLDMDEIGARMLARSFDLEAEHPVADDSNVTRGGREGAAIRGSSRI
ncbi:MAG TPA: hemerythrin domain-containing protein [Burkholderiales bacterium]|jgi:hypothetical protein|nr:hemerythrin domain-containing protein [Burkholderiales bacterium]